MIEHATQPLESTLVGHERRVFGEIAAFRMTSHDERAREGRSDARQVGCCGALRRDHLLEAKVEILLPAGKAAVGTAERQVGDDSIGRREGKRDGGELLFYRFGALIGIERNAHIAHATACGQDVQESLGVLCILHPAVRGERLPIGQHHRVVQQDALGRRKINRRGRFVIEVRKCREHKGVHGVKRGFREGALLLGHIRYDIPHVAIVADREGWFSGPCEFARQSPYAMRRRI